MRATPSTSDTTRLDRAKAQSSGPLRSRISTCEFRFVRHIPMPHCMPHLRLTSPASSHTRADGIARQDGIVTFDYGLKWAVVGTCCDHGQTLRENRRKRYWCIQPPRQPLRVSIIFSSRSRRSGAGSCVSATPAAELPSRNTARSPAQPRVLGAKSEDDGTTGTSDLPDWRLATYCLTTERNTLGSKYCAAGTGFSILPTRV